MAVDSKKKCTCCGNAFSSTRKPYKSPSELFKENDGETTVCMDCVNDLFNKYVKKYKDRLFALYHICAKFGWYFDEEIFKNTDKKFNENGNSDKMFVSLYITQSNMKQNKNKGKTFNDNLQEEYEESQKCEQFDSIEHGEFTDVEKSKNRHVMIQRWGEGFSDNEYEFLEEEYNSWASVYNCGEKNMQTLVEEICMTKLIIRRKRFKEESVKDEQKILQELMGSSNLKPMQETGANASEQSTFGNFIKHIENDRPIPEPTDEFKDVDGILKYIRIWFFGHLSRIFGKQNKYSAEYEKEIENYTVEIPIFEDEE